MSALAYLGPEGTFTHQAALDLARPGDELRPAATAVDVVRAVAAGAVDGGVVAFENSLEGSVAENLDEILHQPEVVLAGERALPVSFALLRAPGDEAPLRAVASHPVALAECARFLREHRLEALEAASTAAAARELTAAAPGTGALAPVTAAQVYGLRVEQEGLEDDTGPSTASRTRGSATCPSHSIRKRYSPSSARVGRDSIVVRLIPRTENSCSSRTSEPGSSRRGVTTKKERSRPVGAGQRDRSTTKRVDGPVSSSSPSRSTRSP